VFVPLFTAIVLTNYLCLLRDQNKVVPNITSVLGFTYAVPFALYSFAFLSHSSIIHFFLYHHLGLCNKSKKRQESMDKLVGFGF